MNGKCAKWTISRKFIVISLAVLCVGLAVIYVAMFLIMIPSTNHYKRYRPFSFAIQHELGGDAADSIKNEYLQFCSYLPIRQCVKLVIDANQFGKTELDKIDKVAANVCGSVADAGGAEIEDYARRLGWAEYSALSFRNGLFSYARCSGGQSAYRADSVYPAYRDDGFLVVTLMANAY